VIGTIGVVLNVVVALILGVCAAISVSMLRRNFGRTFKQEVNQIITILSAFSVTFFLRICITAWEEIRLIVNHKTSCQITIDLEALIIPMLLSSTPIGMIFYLHRHNANSDRKLLLNEEQASLLDGTFLSSDSSKKHEQANTVVKIADESVASETTVPDPQVWNYDEGTASAVRKDLNDKLLSGNSGSGKDRSATTANSSEP